MTGEPKEFLRRQGTRPTDHIANILADIFIAEISRAIWRAGLLSIRVRRAEDDVGGYDVVVGCKGGFRILQLRFDPRGKVATSVKWKPALLQRGGGCVVWLDYDPVTLEFVSYLWFDGDTFPNPMPNGEPGSSATTGAPGSKPLLLKRWAFSRVAGMDALALALFGSPRSAKTLVEKLVDLAPLAAAFRAVAAAPDDEDLFDATCGTMIGGDGGAWYFRFAGALDRFHELGLSDWSLFEIEGMRVHHLGRHLRDRPKGIARASPLELAAVITSVVREERFSDGAMAQSVRRGTVLSICERGEALLRESGHLSRNL